MYGKAQSQQLIALHSYTPSLTTNNQAQPQTVCLVLSATPGSHHLNHVDRLEATLQQVDAASIIREQLHEYEHKDDTTINLPMGTAYGLMGQLTDLQQMMASTYTYLTDEKKLTPEEALEELNNPEAQAIQHDVEQLYQELEVIDQRVAQAQEQIQSLARATQQPIIEQGKSATAQTKVAAKRQTTKVAGNNNSTQDNVQTSISSQDAEKFVNSLAFEVMMPEHAQRELAASLQQERLALIESYEHKWQQRSRLYQWTETAQIYGEAALGALQEAKDYIVEHPVRFGAQAGEMLPLGYGAMFTVGNQSYAVSQNEKTVLQAGKDITVDVAVGVIGGKLLKGVGKASKFLKGRFTAKVEQEVAKRTSSGYGVTKHGVVRKIEREVKSEDILDALKNPLKINGAKTDSKGRLSQRFIGTKATVAINPETKNIVSVNATASKLAKKLTLKD